MKKIIKILSLPLMATPTIFFTSCNKCVHEASDELVSLFAGDCVGAMYKCKHCGDAVYVDKNPTPEVINMPVINLVGDFTGMTKKQEKQLKCVYTDPINPSKNFEQDGCTVKWQGNSSLEYPKKNFNVKLKNKVQLLDGYKKTKKYSFKANYCDSANIRNIMLSNIAETVYAAEGISDCYSGLLHYGLISGYQVSLYCNDVFWGIYNVSTKKDVEMWTSSDESTWVPKGIIVGDDYTASTKLFEHVNSDASNGWEIEYLDDKDPEAKEKLINSFNKFIDTINDTPIEDFPSAIDKCSSKTRLIDYMIMLQAFALEDNWAKNIIWVTYDYDKWYPFLYDLDLTLGVNYFTLPVFPDAKFDSFNNSCLFKKLWKACFVDIKSKYQSLRQTTLSNSQMNIMVEQYFAQSNKIANKSNKEKWSSAPYSGVESTSTFIKNWIITRLNWLDTHFDEN